MVGDYLAARELVAAVLDRRLDPASAARRLLAARWVPDEKPSDDNGESGVAAPRH